LGRAPSGVKGQSSWSSGQGVRTLKLKAFCFVFTEVQTICKFMSIFASPYIHKPLKMPILNKSIVVFLFEVVLLFAAL